MTELELRVKMAIEQLHSLANEYLHRQHGCHYAEIDHLDLEQVIAILEGREP